MCGFVGMVGDFDVSGAITMALQALQHRGQDSAGIYTRDGDRFLSHKSMGLVRDGFDTGVVAGLTGGMGIGHVRYPTLGMVTLDNAQPFFSRRPGAFMAHNGNIINYDTLRQGLAESSVQVLSGCDVEPMLLVFAEALMEQRRADHTLDDVVRALKETYAKVVGAYSFAVALRVDGRDTLICCRDPRGIRPGVWGGLNGTWIAASESVALDALDIPCSGDIPPGHALFLRKNEEPLSMEIQVEDPAPCVFEEIYFARPDSVIGGHTVYQRRLLMGRLLAQQWLERGLECDRVIPVPDTSRPAAGAFAEEIGVPYREGFIKNRYTGRTFIMPDMAARGEGLRLKVNPIRAEFEGQRVVVMDDSIVRGTTIGRIVGMIRKNGAKEIHVVVHAPPVLFPCYYGIDMSTPEELAARRIFGREPAIGEEDAARKFVDTELTRTLGVDSLTYLSVETLRKIENGGRCMACFDGRYPVPITKHIRDEIERNRRSVTERSTGLACGGKQD